MLHHYLLIAATLATAICMFVRRHTWHSQWERAISAAVILWYISFILASPQIDQSWLGPFLSHIHGGRPEPEDVWANCFAMASELSFLYGLTNHLALSERSRAKFLSHKITLPVTLYVPLLVGVFWYTPQYLSLTMTLALTVFGINVLIIQWIILRDDRRATGVQVLYWTSSTMAFYAIQAQEPWTNTVIPEWTAWPVETIGLIVFCAGATLSWVNKRRWLKAHMWRDIRREKPLRRKGPKPVAPKEFDTAL